MEVLWLSTRFVPVTAAKFGTDADHALQFDPLSVEYRYSSAVVPLPPDPADIITVKIWPEHTFAIFGLLVIIGAIGSATTVQLKTTGVELVQPDPVAVRYV